MILLVTGGVAAGKTTLIQGITEGLEGAGQDVALSSDRQEIHVAVINDCKVGPSPHGEVRRNEAGDAPGIDTRVGLFDAWYLARAHDTLIRRIRGFIEDHEKGILLVEWATGPAVDFSQDLDWSGDEDWRRLNQTLDGLLSRLQREGLLPMLHLIWVDRPAAARAGVNATRRDAVPDDDFSLLGPAGGGLHELSAEGLRRVASLADEARFVALRNGKTREALITQGRELARRWTEPGSNPLQGPSTDDGGTDLTDLQRAWVQAARRFIREDQGDDASGHDHHHSERVWAVARRLARETQGADPVVVELAALLHDVDDWKRGPEHRGKTAAWLREAGIPEALSAQILDCIQQISFKTVDQPRPDTIEARLVQDSDRLDALGAIGLARLFAFGGSRARAIHDPAEGPHLGMDAAAYRANKGTSVNHIYEKILHLKDLLNTDAARALGVSRHRYVEDFLQRLLDEWEGRR